MVLPEPSKSRARIHMGLPTLGIQDSGFALGYRFSIAAGQFENRMNKLQPFEFAWLTGTPTAAIGLTSSQAGPQVGDTITVGINELPPVTYTVTSQDVNATFPDMTPQFAAGYSVANNLSQAVLQASSGLFIGSAQPAVNWPQTAIGPGPPNWQVSFLATTGVPVTVTVSTTGATYAYIVQQGTAVKPSNTFADDGVTATGYIPMCDYLESKVAAASDLMKYSVADVVTFRRDEMQARDALYEYWRQKLADIFGIPLFSMPPVGNFGGVNTGLIV